MQFFTESYYYILLFQRDRYMISLYVGDINNDEYLNACFSINSESWIDDISREFSADSIILIRVLDKSSFTSMINFQFRDEDISWTCYRQQALSEEHVFNQK